MDGGILQIKYESAVYTRVYGKSRGYQLIKNDFDDLRPEFRSLKVRSQPTSRWSVALLAQLLTVANAMHRRKYKTIVSMRSIAGAGGNTLPVVLVQPETLTRPAPILIYLHGGAFVFKHAPQHLENCVRYAREAGCCVVMVDYRLAPAHPFPAAFDDSYDSLRWTLSRADELGIDRRRMAVGGDSAGGALAAALAQKLLHEEGIDLRGQLLVYPLTDARCQRPSMLAYAELPPFKASPAFWEIYLGKPLSAGLPRYASPIDGDLHGLAPAYIEIGQFDRLHDQGAAYAQALVAQGVEVELNEVKGAVHGFDLLVPQSAVSLSAMQSRIEFLRRVFSQGVGGRWGDTVWQSRPGRSLLACRDANGFLNLTEALLAEEHFVADKKGRYTKDTAPYRGLGIGNQLCFDGWIIGRLNQCCAVETCGVKNASDHPGIVHLRTGFPHGLLYRCEIDHADAGSLCGNIAAHKLKRVDGEVGVVAEGCEIVPADEPLNF